MTDKRLFVMGFQLMVTSILFFLIASGASAESTVNAESTVSAEDAEDADDAVGLYGAVRGGAIFSSATADAYSERVSHLDFDKGYQVGFSGGFQLTEWVRWDVIDFLYYKSDVIESGWIAEPNGLIAIYRGKGLSLTTGFRFGDFRASSRFHPYVSMGLGASRADLVLNLEETSEWGMDANVGVGIEYKVFSHMAVGIRYQFRWVDMDVEFPPAVDPPGPSMVDLSMQYQTLALEFVFF